MAERPLSARQLIMRARIAAESHITAIKEADPLTYELVDTEIYEFIKSMYHLTDEDCTTDNFSELTKISLAKSLEISPELVREFDLARSCDGTSSHTAKMVLLFQKLQNVFEIKFDPLDTAYEETVHDIARMVYDELIKKKS